MVVEIGINDASARPSELASPATNTEMGKEMDLSIAIAFIVAISGLAFLAGRELSLTVYRSRPLLLIECLIFLVIFAFGVANRLFWANTFSDSAAMCWANWLPVFHAFTAGLALNAGSLRRRYRLGFSVALLLLGVAFLLQPVVRPNLYPIDLAAKAKWKDGVCLQSHEASCGPAAAASLLRCHALIHVARLNLDSDQSSTEAIMAEACLTSRQGTSSLCLVRGLRLATLNSGYTVSVADPNPRRWVSKGQLPNVAVICFRAGRKNDTVRRLLGTGGDAHAVMVYGRTNDGEWKVADPAVGWRYFRDEEFQSLFTGEAIFLSKNES